MEIFNGSQRTMSDESLNFNLLIGTNLLPLFSNVLMLYRYVLMLDVKKMCLQICVFPEDQDYSLAALVSPVRRIQNIN